MRTIPIEIGNGKNFVRTVALLDDGSNTSYIAKDIVRQLCVIGKNETVKIQMINDTEEEIHTERVSTKIKGIESQEQWDFKPLVVKNVIKGLKTINWGKEAQKWNHLQDIKFPQNYKDEAVQVLIGLDHPELHVSLEERIGGQFEPIARRTKLGWTVVGRVQRKTNKKIITNLGISHPTHDEVINEFIPKYFWEIEESRNHPGVLTKIDQQILENTENTMNHYGQRYGVKIPWNEQKCEWYESKATAEKRLMTLQQRFSKDKCLGEEYHKILKEYKEKGYIREINELEDVKAAYYLPHFPVIKMAKVTTKIRIVFDAAAKSKGICLNDMINP